METTTMGKVLVSAKIENLSDLVLVNAGQKQADEIRSIEVTDALVDRGAFGLLMPKRMIAQLGLDPLNTRTAVTAAGPVALNTYRAVRLTLQGRDCISDVTELPENCPVLIGQLPLEMMDWVVDPKRQCVVGNPAHGGEHILEVYLEH